MLIKPPSKKAIVRLDNLHYYCSCLYYSYTARHFVSLNFRFYFRGYRPGPGVRIRYGAYFR